MISRNRQLERRHLEKMIWNSLAMNKFCRIPITILTFISGLSSYFRVLFVCPPEISQKRIVVSYPADASKTFLEAMILEDYRFCGFPNSVEKSTVLPRFFSAFRCLSVSRGEIISFYQSVCL